MSYSFAHWYKKEMLNWACPDLYGGCSVMGIPTAILARSPTTFSEFKEDPS